MNRLVVPLALAACSSSSPHQPADAPGRDGAAADAPHADAAKADAPAGVYPFYATTNTTLYRVDTPQSAPVQLGAYDCIGGAGQDTAMTDLAVDASGVVWGISAHDIYSLAIGVGSVHCATTVALPGGAPTFYGLSFAPAGVLDATKEVLVAVDTAGELWSVGAQGTLAQHGTFGTVPANDGHGHTYANAGTAWELAGDIVMLRGPAGYATVRDCPSPPSPAGCDTTDTLVELDLTKLALPGTQSVVKSVRGEVVKAAGCSDPSATSYGSFYGIAAGGGSVVGFSHTGGVVQISEADGTGCIAYNAAGDAWSGAGVSTLAAP